MGREEFLDLSVLAARQADRVSRQKGRSATLVAASAWQRRGCL